MSFLDDRFREACQDAEIWIRAAYGEVVPSDAEFTAARSASAGWKVPIAEGAGSFFVLVDQHFPYSLPRVYLVDRPDLLAGPHVEAHGRLCTVGDAASADTLAPAEVVRYLIEEASALVADNEKGLNRDDFRIDFPAYWRRDKTEQRDVLTWLTPNMQSRRVKAWHGTQNIFVAETEEDCCTWLANRYTSDTDLEVRDALAVWLHEFPEPSDYPQNVTALRELIRTRSPDGLQLLDSILVKLESSLVVIMIGPTVDQKTAQAAVIVRDPSRQTASSPAPRPGVARGFRPGKVPPSVIAMRTRSVRAEAEDTNARETRLPPGLAATLANLSVVILGAGSLGAGVARILLQTGIGKLDIVDSDLYTWPNLARHELGADSVGQPKAIALERKFRAMYPHVRRLKGHHNDWRKALQQQPDLMKLADLVISVTGDWNSDSALNDLKVSKEIGCPVLHGWMENAAGAAHAVVLDESPPCFRCGFERSGKPIYAATSWPKDVAPECGGPASIYGAADLASAQTLIASLATDTLLKSCQPPVWRVWLAPESTLKASGGEWNSHWRQQICDQGRGGRLFAATWKIRTDCSCVPPS